MLRSIAPRSVARMMPLLVFVCLSALMLPFGKAAADDAEHLTGPTRGPAEVDGDFDSAILIDAATGLVLAAKDPDLVHQPASMVKMLTELIVLEWVASGNVGMDDVITVSARASRMGGSQVYLAHNEQFTVEELLEALAIHSANDAAVALAEHVAGSVEAFVDLMNDRARRLGMHKSEFHTVHGLPPGRGQSPDLTTARDMAVLAQALLEYPEALEWSSQSTAPFRGGEFLMYNPNKLVGQYRGLDGLKTGYHSQAGFCVTATAVQQDVRLISVVMGCGSDRARATETTRLLSYGFSQFEPVTLVAEAGAPFASPAKVEGGKSAELALTYAGPLVVNVPRDLKDQLQLRHEVMSSITAPVARGDKLGEALAVLDDRVMGRVDLLASESVEAGNWFHRLFR